MPTTTRQWLLGLLCGPLLCFQAFATNIPPTGTGAAYASKCNAAKQHWLDIRGRLSVSVTTSNSSYVVYPASTIYTTSTFLSSDATPYTLCDGYPRINGSRTITSTVSTYRTTSTVEVSSTVYRKIPQPKCTIQPSDCAVLASTYSHQLVAFSRNSTGLGAPTSPVPPICGSATLVPQTSVLGSPVCAMQEASVQLLYWPVKTVKPCDACHRSDCPTTTLGPTISGKPNTIVTWNNTLTSPTVYIAFEGYWAYTSAGKTYSEAQTLLLAQNSASVSTLCGRPGGGYGPPRSVNYANFLDPVPADVYRCQPECFLNPLPYPEATITNTYTYAGNTSTTLVTGTQISTVSFATANLCSTIWDDYRPVLSIPHEFKTINPAGFVDASSFGIDAKNPCQFIFNENAVLFDPPIALTEDTNAAKPTLPGANSANPTPGPTTHQSSIPIATPQAQSLGHSPHSQVQPGPTLPNPRPDSTGINSSPGPTLPTPGPHPAGDVIASVIGLIKPAEGHSHDGWTLALATDGSALVVNDMTTSVKNAQEPDGGIITMGSSKIHYTEAGGTIVIGDQTLSPGGKITIGGDTSDGSNMDGTHTSAPTRTTDSSGTDAPAATTSGASLRTAMNNFQLLLSALVVTTIWLSR